MGVDPNNVSVDWSAANPDSNINVNTLSTNAETPNPLITPCIESKNPLISKGFFTENSLENTTH